MTSRASSPCPDTAVLRDYAAGMVSQRHCELISQHLTDCTACLQTLEHTLLIHDSFLERLQRALPDPQSQLDPDCAAMIESLRFELQCGSSRDAETRPVSPAAQTDSASNGMKLPCEFGRYRLQALLGQGGMGAVYRAFDTRLERDVALKIPGSSLTDRERRRFLREARAAATISHPNVCPVFDVGEVADTPYFTMQLIPGSSLAAALKSGRRFTPREAVSLVVPLAQALAAAHRQGIIHRDIKAANVLLNAEGVPLLADFGLAQRRLLQETELTRSGEILGTPAYASPEQVRGDQSLVGPASDIYSLGVLLFELITGRRPFTGSTAEILAAVLQTPAPSPSQWVPDLAPCLAHACQKALAKAIADRWESMDEFSAALTECLRERPATTPVTQRRWRVWIVGGLVLVPLVAIAALAIRGKTGRMEVRRNGSAATLVVTDDQGAAYRLGGESTAIALPPGRYHVELEGASPSMDLTPSAFTLSRFETAVVEIRSPSNSAIDGSLAPSTLDRATRQPKLRSDASPPTVGDSKPAPASPAVAIQVLPFAIAVRDLTPERVLDPLGAVPDWQHPNVFAELRQPGTLEYSPLRATRYVLETELVLREPGCSLDIQLGNERFRVWQRLDWDPATEQYRCRLQRFHGRGTWTIGAKQFPRGQRLRFRFVMRDGMAVLYEGDRQILHNPSMAVEPTLRIVFGGQGAKGGTLYRCQFRPLTDAEDARAAELAAPTEAPDQPR